MKKYFRKLKSGLSVFLNTDLFYGRKSFSQEGEDLILEKLFHGQKNGFFVDVGAHHPFRYSNTQLLYRNGWKGINIEPTPGKVKLFEKTRKRDINLALGVGNKDISMRFYEFEDHALNTFNKKNANKVIGSGQSKYFGTKKVEVKMLSTILDKYTVVDIDYLNVDVEGGEMEVLKSNNWKNYKPRLITVENLNKDKKLQKYLKEKKYKLIAKTLSTEFYRLDK